jgi:transposase InsO family protein
MRASVSRLPLPKHWTRSIQSALVHIVTLAHYALAYSRDKAATGGRRLRRGAEVDRLEQEIALLREEIRIKDARMARIPPGQRPHYQPTERLEILELRAARGWSLAQTSKTFQVTAATVASWSKRLDEHGPAALLRTRQPINRFPDFVSYIVQRLQVLCPSFGKVKIAQMLARAGLHLGVATVGRLRRQPPPSPQPPVREPMRSGRRVTAKYPNHVWHFDLTTVPTSAGLWTSWLPFALPQCWPFCWWLAVVLDHYSRRALGFAIFKRQPTSEQLRCFLGKRIAAVGVAPKHLITDCGTQFTCDGFAPWCHKHGILHRHGAVGQTGTIALVERFIRTVKDGCTRLLPVVPLLRRALQGELQLFFGWYNSDRPHMSLQGATPDEVCFGRQSACHAPRFEPRPSLPRASPCARPQTLVKGQPGVRLDLTVEFVGNRRYLPRVKLTRAA